MAKWYYNGVLLPEIPQDALAEYPYCWIRSMPTNESYPYCLFMSNKPSYMKYSDTLATQATFQMYYLSTPDVTSATSWILNSTVTVDCTYTINSTSLLLWSSHDIPNGSADATEIYFAGSYPIDENGNEVGKPEEPEPTYSEKYTVKSEWLVSMADEVRRLTGTKDKLTTEQILNALKHSNVLQKSIAYSEVVFDITSTAV